MKEVSMTHHDAVPPPRPWPRSRLLNVWVDNLSMAQMLEKLDAGFICTLNPDQVWFLHHDRAYYEAYRQADFVTSDSKYVYWGLKLIGRPIQEKVSGSDLFPNYCYHHRDNPTVKVFLLGAAPGVAQKARENINARCGREVVIGAHSPPMGFGNNEDDIARVIRIINDSGATALVMGINAPRQEIWLAKYRHAMPGVKVFIGVGAAIDYEAGVVKRAPRWMTRNGLEWIYRITTQPRRYWRRYLRDLEYFWLLFKDGLGLYRSPWSRDTSGSGRADTTQA
ncbi:N-acetylglucosaminyldiphosphoundecaprenol N-acetyl-beta-D-mannosaminyltransferase [Planctomycetaceae bacterium]|nr:N-acetylglucosaminyldiphosphoundecaprenol N-acetyl-beta-D-mannosaminyltransferase [Planctomycetaceae bacterium]